jgi:serine/threonine-protein kinase HipA
MRLAAAVGIELPQHGLLYSSDESLTYFVKRFDRTGRHAKVAVEDFAQLSLRTRETKYSASMEQVAEVLERFTTFPTIARRELFLRTVFCFLVGNEDMHLKNLSLITSRDRISLSPAYDLVSTTLLLPGVREELALSIRGRKNRLTRSDLIDSFGRERLALTNQAIDGALARFQAAADEWEALVAASFLPADLQRAYRELLRERAARLFG